MAAMLDHLASQEIIALDTESDSLYSYYTKICLIQISTFTGAAAAANPTDPEGVADYLVDPLNFGAVDQLAPLLADPAHEIIIHAAENDLLLLRREFGLRVARLFDTQLAARILGWSRAGLAAILEEHFGVVSDKRMQRTNWGNRPLSQEQIAYAQMDTHFLMALRARQIEELLSCDRWEEAQEGFAQLAAIDYSERPMNERTLWHMKETRQVPHARMGVLEALWIWREEEAKSQDRPPFKIVNNRALVALAEKQPRNDQELVNVAGVGRQDAKRYGKAILRTIREGQKRPLPDLPEPSLRPEQMLEPETLACYDALREWRAQKAEARGVAPDIVLTNDLLLEIAKQQPERVEELQQVDGIGPWKARTYGPEILRIVARRH